MLLKIKRGCFHKSVDHLPLIMAITYVFYGVGRNKRQDCSCWCLIALILATVPVRVCHSDTQRYSQVFAATVLTKACVIYSQISSEQFVWWFQKLWLMAYKRLLYHWRLKLYVYYIAPPRVLSSGNGDFLPGLERPGREADHSPPSHAEIKNVGAVPPLPHTSSWCGF
jgi:hypothetical protein